MSTIAEKIKQYIALQAEVDAVVYAGLSKYLNETKQLFSGPEYWIIDEDFKGIRFYGEDGCMGCYDRVSFYIPMHYFGLSEEDFK